jgi:c-di-GMP phosphodiesterase
VAVTLIRQALDKDASIERVERYRPPGPGAGLPPAAARQLGRLRGQHEIGALRHAIMMLGFTALDRWLVEQLAGADEDLALHPVRYGHVMQARLAQHLLDSGSDEELRAEVYTTAIFGQLDRLMHEPLAQLIGHLPLSPRVADALLSHTGPYHPLLDIAARRATPPASTGCPASARSTRSRSNTPTAACCACWPPAATTDWRPNPRHP